MAKTQISQNKEIIFKIIVQTYNATLNTIEGNNVIMMKHAIYMKDVSNTMSEKAGCAVFCEI